MTRDEKIAAAKEYVVAKIGDIIERNYDQPGAALETSGTFTGLIEAYRAIEIAETGSTIANSKEALDSYIATFRT